MTFIRDLSLLLMQGLHLSSQPHDLLLHLTGALGGLSMTFFLSSQPHDLLLHLGDQVISLSKLLLQVPLFLTQGNQFFFGSHVPSVLVSGSFGTPFSTPNNYTLLFIIVIVRISRNRGSRLCVYY